MKPKKKKGGKEKKPDYRKTETFQDYKSAAATFADFNPGTDTVFVGASIDPGMADRKANHNTRVSAAKGASSPIPSDSKMFKTKNEAGETVYVSLNKNKKYSKGGMMKPKYKKGGKVTTPSSKKEAFKKRALEFRGEKPKGYKEKSKKMGVSTLEERQAAKLKRFEKGGKVKGKTVTKEMVDKEFAHNFEVNANLTNKMAKQASTGLKKNGFPMKPANVKALKEQVKKRKEKEGKAKPNYRYVGTKVPGGPTPRFKKGGKMKKYLKGGQVKLDANKDGKITGQDFKMLRKK